MQKNNSMRLILLVLISTTILMSQDWVDDMQNPELNFYEVQREFENYWLNKSIEKGKGWKQFKRWENFIEPRVFPDGILKPEILFEQYQSLNRNNIFRMNPPNIWTQVGPNNVPLQSNGAKRGIGRVNTIAFHPTNPDMIYVGAPAGGFWKSDNGGQTWQTTTDFLTNLGVSDIAINPSNTNEIYIITGDRDAGDTYSYGLMKSSDGGLTFNTTGLSFNITGYYRGNRVLIDPIDNDIIIVATSNGIYRSTDAGINFTQTFQSINMTDIEFHPTNSNIIYGASKGNTSIYKSVDNGINWSVSGSGLPSTNSVVRACVAVTPDNPSIVYALFGNNSNGFYAVYKSTNEGQSWVQQSNSPNLLGWSITGSDSEGQAWYDLAFACDPNDENILFVGGVNTWKSTDGGQNWSLNTHWYGGGGATYKHADVHMLKYSDCSSILSSTKPIYSANDGGLYVSYDNGNSWTDISDGLQITQIYSLGVSQTVQDLVITGTQDNGTFLKDNTNWDAVIGGDGMECIIDYTNSNIMYGALYYGDIRKSVNGGNSFSSIGPASNGAWETPYVIDRNNNEVLYAGYTELYKTNNGGANWSTITNNVTNGGKIDEIALSKSNQSVIYFSDGPNLYKTNDGGNNWSNINNNLPYRYISYIIVHPNDENKLWITMSGYGSGEKVYKSIDGGSTWQNISGTLPNIPCNTIVLDENSSLETIYVGTDLGVFTTDSTVSDWSSFNNNSLPNVIVSELEIQYSSNKLIASTYGRGLWSIDLQITSPPSANFFASDSIFCNIPASVDFTNSSFYSNSYYWDFGDGNTSTSTSPSHTYMNFGIYTVSLIASGPLGTDSIISQSLINIDPNNPCIITLPVNGSGTTQTSCNGTLYDVGGPNSNYYDNNDSWITIAPMGSSQVTLNFTDFDIEAPSSSTDCNWDYLEIFDGNSINAPSLGQFCNVLTGSPGTISSSSGSITVLLHADAAVNGRGFALNWTCTFPQSAPVSSFVANDTVSCNGLISFTDLSTNGPSSWSWDFGDGNYSSLQNPTHTYNNSGVYTVSLITSNVFGADTLIYFNYIDVIDGNLVLLPDSACGPSTLTLQSNSTSNNVHWYSDPNLQNLVGSGPNYTTPLLNNSTTYYARNEYFYNSIYGGPLDNSFGGGSYYQGNRHLIFDNYYPSTLKSVLVYANTGGNRIIELRNSSNAVIMDTNIYIPASPNGSRVILNFDLPVQNNMQLGVNGNNSDLYRNNNGAIFPYNISNIVSITGTNASAGYYYYFYDWEVIKDPCVSNTFSVEAIINQDYNYTQNLSLCNGGSITVGNNTYNASGSYTDVFVLQNGCDSTIYTNLTVGNSSTNNISADICNGDLYQVGNNVYTQSGIYVDSLISGNCDSIIITTLNVLNPNISSQVITICQGDSVLMNNSFYSNPGTYYDTLISSQLCDSILITQLFVNNSSALTNYQSICDGSYYSINGNNYSLSGSYYDVLSSTNGCDSTINTLLTVLPVNQVNQNFDICDGDSITVGFSTYYEDGQYLDSLVNLYGCDSIVSTNLSVSQIFSDFMIMNTDLSVSAYNGTTPYTFSIYGPGGLIYSGQTNGTPVVFTPTVNGVYYAIVSDAADCLADTSFAYVEFVATTINHIDKNIEVEKIVDEIGREVQFEKNRLLIYILKNGTVRREIVFE